MKSKMMLPLVVALVIGTTSGRAQFIKIQLGAPPPPRVVVVQPAQVVPVVAVEPQQEVVYTTPPEVVVEALPPVVEIVPLNYVIIGGYNYSLIGGCYFWHNGISWVECDHERVNIFLGWERQHPNWRTRDVVVNVKFKQPAHVARVHAIAYGREHPQIQRALVEQSHAEHGRATPQHNTSTKPTSTPTHQDLSSGQHRESTQQSQQTRSLQQNGQQTRSLQNGQQTSSKVDPRYGQQQSQVGNTRAQQSQGQPNQARPQQVQGKSQTKDTNRDKSN